MGRPNQVTPRLLKVVLDSASLQRLLLGKSRLLKQVEQFKTIHVRPSLTREQRRAEFELREEKRRRMAADPRLDLIIFNGTIINRLERSSHLHEARRQPRGSSMDFQ
jgi:hypothetical protein